MMSVSIIPFLFINIAFHCLIRISNTIAQVEDNMLISFIRSPKQIQISKYSTQKYVAHLGIVYFMKEIWQCEKIDGQFEDRRKDCQIYRKYLHILYEYLCREYAGTPTVKPKFVFKKRKFEIEGPIIYVVNCLVKISQFYSDESLYNHHNLNILFNSINGFFQLKLLNEEKLSYGIKLENEIKVPINEMILQLAIDTAYETQTNENFNEIIQQNFNKNLEEMFKKAVEKAKEKASQLLAYEIENDKHKIILESQFNDRMIWTDDALFSAFVKGLATNSEKFFKMVKYFSKDLFIAKITGNLSEADILLISFGLHKFDKIKEHLTQKFEAHLGIMYLMRENWHCGKIRKELKEKEVNLCQKFRKYLDILYEYVLRLYAEAKWPNIARQLPALKPIFKIHQQFLNLIASIKKLSNISKCFWKRDDQFEEINSCKIDLKNEKALYYCKTEISKNFSRPTEFAKLRKEFAQKMKKMYENTKAKAKEEKAKLEKAIENAKNKEEKDDLRDEYSYKFGTFISSPFS